MIARLADRLAFVATIIVFGAAIFVLMREFGDVSPQEVLARLSAMPARRIAAALGLTAASYLLLTGYDYLALRYARHRLPFCDVMFASFTAFALSNNVGFQILSGGSVRYRIYSRLGLQAAAIGEVVAFCSFAYALGVITIGGVLALYNVGEFAGVLHLPRPLVVVAGMGLLALSFGYVAIAALWRQPIAIRGYRLRPPSLWLAVAQLVLASADALLAASVMYVLLPPDLELSYGYFLGIYTIAATASIFSLLPGGLGVFELAITILMMPSSKAAALGVFVVYRLIYFILPLMVAMAWLVARKMQQRSNGPGRASRSA